MSKLIPDQMYKFKRITKFDLLTEWSFINPCYLPMYICFLYTLVFVALTTVSNPKN